MEVHISEDAFWGLLVSTIEVYKRECFGFLIGYRDSNNIFIVEHALPSQLVKRWNTGVIENKRSERRIKRFLSNLPARWEAATGDTRFCGVVIECDHETGKASSITRLMLKDE